MKKIRCAIYTRKSSEDGLEQSFNSLHAQREACAAYILSQASEGWSLLPDVYDDGGLSGGTLDRPALRRLMDDIGAGGVDIVVVYKVDRLTRSLLDFSTLVQAFDAAGTSFVSITQSFNTTTSMGRLTLNMLLSFAQFEREVTAERIRDKIAASKAKGMWMGGTPPLGYKAAGRTLEIVEEHAAIVRRIFQLYLELGTVRRVMSRMETDKITQPVRTAMTGRSFGGTPFTRGQLYAMLKNALYIGEIVHKDVTHPGLHDAIISRETWDAAQALLNQHQQGDYPAAQVAHPSPLAGRISDTEGNPLVATHACKGTRRYRYYVSRQLQHGVGDEKAEGIRIPAREIESAVAGRITTAFEQPLALLNDIKVPIDAAAVRKLAGRAEAVVAQLKSLDATMLRVLIKSVEVGSESVALTISADDIAKTLGVEPATGAIDLRLVIPLEITRPGKAVRLVQPDSRGVAPIVDHALIGMIMKARKWWAMLQTGESHSAAIAHDEGVTRGYFAKIIGLAFLSPELVEMILDGRQPAHLSGRTITAKRLPLSWVEQRQLIG